MDNRIIAKNPTAYHNYEIVEKIEAGIVLFGTEIKSVLSVSCDKSHMTYQHRFAPFAQGQSNKFGI